MTDREVTEAIEEAQRIGGEGRPPLETFRAVQLMVMERLGARYSEHSLTYVVFHAFDIGFMAARVAVGWSGLGEGGGRSDAEVVRLLGDLVPRSRRRGGPGEE